MKPLLKAILLSVLVVLGGAPIALAQDKTLTINSFGGAYEEAHRKCVITPFEKETGATVKIVTAYSADAFAQLRAQKTAPQYDVIHFSGGQEIVAFVDAAVYYDGEAGLRVGEGLNHGQGLAAHFKVEIGEGDGTVD